MEGEGNGNNPIGGLGRFSEINSSIVDSQGEENQGNAKLESLEGEYFEDAAIYDEDGNVIEPPITPEALAQHIKKSFDIPPNETDITRDERLSRITDYLFRDLKISEPKLAIEVLMDMAENARANSSVPGEIIRAVDQMIFNNKKIEAVKARNERIAKIGGY